jgi:hypothetical protein
MSRGGSTAIVVSAGCDLELLTLNRDVKNGILAVMVLKSEVGEIEVEG